MKLVGTIDARRIDQLIWNTTFDTLPHEKDAATHDDSRQYQSLVGIGPLNLFHSDIQRQRVAIARALLIQPRLIIADEPVSMVDASLRVSILENLRQLNRDFGISILYITHDLATAFQISENMIVLYRGSVAEAGDVERIVHAPQHPYTQLLIDSIPRPNPDQIWAARENTSGAAQRATSTGGCKFVGQCPQVMPACRQSSPPLFQVEENRAVACYLYKDAPVLEATQMDSTFVSKAQWSLISDSNRLGGTNV